MDAEDLTCYRVVNEHHCQRVFSRPQLPRGLVRHFPSNSKTLLISGAFIAGWTNDP